MKATAQSFSTDSCRKTPAWKYIVKCVNEKFYGFVYSLVTVNFQYYLELMGKI